MNELNQNLRLARHPLWRSLPLVILCVGLALAHHYLRYATPLYESSAEIKLAELNPAPARPTVVKASLFSPFNTAGAEVAPLKSRLLVSKALGNLPFAISMYRVGETNRTELYSESPFLVTITQQYDQWDDKVFKLKILPNGRLKLTTPSGGETWGRLGQSLKLPGMVVVIAANKRLLRTRPGLKLADRYEFVRHSPTQLMSDVLDRLDVNKVEKDAPVVRVSYRSAVPEKAADLVNALASVYTADYLANNYKPVKTLGDLIDNQLQAVSSNRSPAKGSGPGYRDQQLIADIDQEADAEIYKPSDLKTRRAHLHMRLLAANDLFR